MGITDMKYRLDRAVKLAPTAILVVFDSLYNAGLDRILMYIPEQHCEIGHIVDRLRLETLFEKVAVASVFAVIIVHVGAGNALYCLAHALIALANQEMEMVGHEAVGIIGAVAAAGGALIVIPHPHTVEGCNELVVVFLVLKDILVVDASHHHVEYPRAGWFARLAWHLLFLVLQHFLFLTGQTTLDFLHVLGCWKIFGDDASLGEHLTHGGIVIHMLPGY